MITLEEIFAEISKYDDHLYTIFPGASDDMIRDLQRKLGYELPGNFKLWLSKCNGLELPGDTIYGIHDDVALDLYDNYIFEKDEVGNPIRPYLLPLRPDGWGNHDCLDLRTLTDDKSECKVIFWQHDFWYEDDEQPEIISDTFLNYLWDVLMFIKECHHYDGTDK